MRISNPDRSPTHLRPSDCPKIASRKIKTPKYLPSAREQSFYALVE